jgi:hypothetical protein
MPNVVVPNSTFLDDYGNNQATAQQFAQLASSTSLANAQAVLGQLYALNGTPATVTVATPDTEVTVGLVLGRATDPTSLLDSSWAVREQVLANQAAVFATYGANPATYAATLAGAEAALGTSEPFDVASAIGYQSSAADRTVWLTLNESQFDTLFGTHLLTINVNTPTGSYQQTAWGGDLSLPGTIAANVQGLWVDQGAPVTNPEVLNSNNAHTPAGPLGIGNSAPFASATTATPEAIATNYNFPLPAGVPTDPIALVETDIPSQAKLFAALNTYREALGLPAMTPSQWQVLSGTDHDGTPSGEVTLDMSVLADVVPNSTQYIYSFLSGTPYNAYQQAFFDTTHHPEVLSSSYSLSFEPTANSPFEWAFQQLFVDGALANVSVSIAAGDQGSSGDIANGIANYEASLSPTFALTVGGTSIATLNSALADPTLGNLVTLALQDDPGTVFGLVQSGLTTLPTHLANVTVSNPSGVLEGLFETVWQSLVLTASSHGLSASYGTNQTGLGSVDTTQPVPFYQSEFGLDPTSSTGTGRGTPDVSALSFGDSFYAALNNAYVSDPSHSLFSSDGGTSAAAPLWAALTAEFNAVFHDQGLPSLGFYNDLLYVADVIAPGSFNDILLGTNTNSFITVSSPSGYFNPALGEFMVPTGDGYSAGPGYDLASGLGTPDALLLARALTEIAHTEMSGSSHDVVNSDGHGGWTSGADQTLLFQTLSGDGVSVGLNVGPDAFGFFSQEAGSFAWTSQLAEQSLQPDFDPSLVTLFDKQAQGAVVQVHYATGESLGVTLDGQTGQAIQESLSSPFGFADFFGSSGVVRAASPVAVAQNADGGDNEIAIARIRQDGTDSLSLTFYRVDDANGTINGLHPGDAGYQAALQSRAYQLSSGATSVAGPGYGNYEQADLMHVNQGDIIAMQLTNNTHGNTYLPFAQANEVVNGQHVDHLWNYGSNVWGWEDTFGGGDRDYNDLVVGFDFTSASGHGWLA